MSVAGDEGGRAAELFVYDSKPLGGGGRSHILRGRTAPPPPQLPTQLDLRGARVSSPATTTSAIAATTLFLLTLLEEWGMKPQPRESC